MATSTTSVALSPLLVKLNVTGLQKRDQPLYDFLSHLLFSTGQIANAVGIASSSGGGGGGSTTNITNILQQFNLGDPGSGDDGSPGPPGPQGNPGTSGSSGATGPIGPATYLTDISAPDEVFPIPGPIGPQGNQGSAGLTGASGPVAFLDDITAGDDAFPIPGPIGPQGNTGLTGNDGPAIFITALDGADGEPSSIPGPQGPQGNTGSTGATGNDGPGIFITDEHYVDDPIPIPGSQGPTGNPGATGNTGAPGQVQSVFIDDWNYPDIPIQVGVPVISGMVLLGRVVASGSPTTIDFPNIISVNTLLVAFASQDTTAGTNASALSLKINNDGTAGNYSSTQRVGTQQGAIGGLTLLASSAAGWNIADHPNAGNTNKAVYGTLWLSNATGTTFHKSFVCNWRDEFGTGPPFENYQYSGNWLNTGAINRLTFSCGTAFTTGSTFSLYGLL